MDYEKLKKESKWMDMKETLEYSLNFSVSDGAIRLIIEKIIEEIEYIKSNYVRESDD